VVEFFRNTVEYQNFGFNALTISSLATVIFTLFQGWGFWKQNQSIWKERSGKSVSVNFFSYCCFYFFTFIIYGAYKHGLAMMFNGCLGFVVLPILIGLGKYKGFTRSNVMLILVFGMMIPAMIFTSEKDSLFTMLLFGILFSAITQPYEIWKTKNAGAVDPRLSITFIVNGVFWFVYALSIGNRPLAIFQPIAVVFFSVTLALWKKYQPAKGGAR